MYRLASLALPICIFVAANASGARDIVLLSGNANKVTINDVLGTIEITDGDASTFVFECFDDVTGNPADIEDIGLAGTPSGTITISILPGTGHTYGAATVKKIDLSTAGVTGVIDEMIISGNLATADDVTCDDITGDIDVGGSLSLYSPRYDLVADDVSGALTFSGGIYGDITVNTLADLTVGGVGGYLVGGITVAQAYSDTMTINDGYNGAIDIGGVMSGLIDINGPHLGTITIGDALTRRT